MTNNTELLEAENALEKQDLDLAYSSYSNLGLITQAAFTKLLAGDLDLSYSLYSEAPSSPAQRWGIFLTKLIRDTEVVYPGYLAFRLYLEPTVWYFIANNQEKFIEPFLRYQEVFLPVYNELIKDIGAAYLAHKNYNLALKYLKQALELNPEDLGAIYKTAVAYLEMQQKSISKEYFSQCLKYLPNSPMILEYLEQCSD